MRDHEPSRRSRRRRQASDLSITSCTGAPLPFDAATTRRGHRDARKRTLTREWCRLPRPRFHARMRRFRGATWRPATVTAYLVVGLDFLFLPGLGRLQSQSPLSLMADLNHALRTDRDDSAWGRKGVVGRNSGLQLPVSADPARCYCREVHQACRGTCTWEPRTVPRSRTGDTLGNTRPPNRQGLRFQDERDMKRILYATTNPTKVARLRELVSHLPLQVLTLDDVNRDSQVTEDGHTPAENARKKVEVHYGEGGMPTVAIDSGLHIDRFPKERQPGLFVRRIRGTGDRATDEEMVRYYQQELDNVGGKSQGTWTTAIALKVSAGHTFSETFTSETLFSSRACDVLTPGEPLNALQIDAETGKYFSEMTPGSGQGLKGGERLGWWISWNATWIVCDAGSQHTAAANSRLVFEQDEGRMLSRGPV